MRPSYPFRAFAMAGLLVLATAAGANANDTIGEHPAGATRLAQVVGPKSLRPATACEALSGSWHNVNPTTRSITHIDLSTDCAAGSATIHVWGACHPRDCDWRPFSGTYDQAKRVITGRWTASFKDADLTIQADAQGHVVVTTFSHFKDKSGRKDYTVVDTMER